jgi:hypothetical protein
MKRGFALTVSLLLAGALPALAQHPGHPAGAPHDPNHMAMDSASHAALHALIHGTWTGTLQTAHGTSGIELSVLHDSLMKEAMRMTFDRPARSGLASNLSVRGDTLRWTQDLSGTACAASAVVNAAMPDQLSGRMICGSDEATFTLHKKT